VGAFVGAWHSRHRHHLDKAAEEAGMARAFSTRTRATACREQEHERQQEDQPGSPHQGRPRIAADRADTMAICIEIEWLRAGNHPLLRRGPNAGLISLILPMVATLKGTVDSCGQ